MVWAVLQMTEDDHIKHASLFSPTKCTKSVQQVTSPSIPSIPSITHRTFTGHIKDKSSQNEQNNSQCSRIYTVVPLWDTAYIHHGYIIAGQLRRLSTMCSLLSVLWAHRVYFMREGPTVADGIPNASSRKKHYIIVIMAVAGTGQKELWLQLDLQIDTNDAPKWKWRRVSPPCPWPQ